MYEYSAIINIIKNYLHCLYKFYIYIYIYIYTHTHTHIHPQHKMCVFKCVSKYICLLQHNTGMMNLKHAVNRYVFK